MLDYTKKIKELKNEIEILELEKAKIDILIHQYIEDNGLIVNRSGHLSRHNDREKDRHVADMRIEKAQLTTKIYTRREQIEHLNELIRLSMVDSICIYEPDYFNDVIRTNGYIGCTKF